MKVFYLPLLVSLLCACNNHPHQKPGAASLAVKEQDTSFKWSGADSTRNSYTKSFDYRYSIRVKKLAEKLNLDNLERGSDSFTLRLWHISSWGNPQAVYTLKQKDHSWELKKYQLSVKLATWDLPSWTNPEIEFINEKQSSNKTLFPSSFIDSLAIGRFWQYPSQSEMKDYYLYGDCVDQYAIVIELADKRRYKYLFYQCPENYVAQDSVFSNVAEFQQRLSGTLNKFSAESP